MERRVFATAISHRAGEGFLNNVVGVGGASCYAVS
jgi:hypothetical protein